MTIYCKVISTTGTHSSTLGTTYPFRYKGYYYDAETGLFYVGSRYYDPELGRFLNADDANLLNVLYNILQNNLYTYCNNNPIMFYDPTGYLAIRTDLIIEAIDIGLLLIPILSGVNKVLKVFRGVGLEGKKVQKIVKFIINVLTKAMSAIKKLIVTVLKKMGVKDTAKLIAKIATIGTLSAALNELVYYVLDITIVAVLVWIACLFLKPKIGLLSNLYFGVKTFL